MTELGTSPPYQRLNGDGIVGCFGSCGKSVIGTQEGVKDYLGESLEW
jgi:hypothetical protein